MQSSFLMLEGRRRVDGTRMQSSCLEFEEKDAEQLLRVKREKRVEGRRMQKSCLK